MSKVCEHHHNCIEELRADHEEILRHLDLLNEAVNGIKINKKKVKEFLHFTETFAEPHHRKEEDVLFPELEKRGIPKDDGPIGVMLFEHETKREYVKNLQMAVKKGDKNQIKENSLAIIALLRDHINKENNILYPMAEQVLSKEDLVSFSHKCRQLKSRLMQKN